MELTRIGRELKCKNVRGENNIPAEDGNSSAWLWQEINIERKVPWTPHGLFFFLQKNWLFLAVSKTIQKISKLSDLLLWQLWQATIQLRVQSLEKLKEALWSPPSQGSKICIYKKIKVRNGRQKISESSSATSNLFVEACYWLNDDQQKRNSNQEMPCQQTLDEAQWSSSHGLLIPGNAAAVATAPTYPHLCFWLECLFCLCNCSLLFSARRVSTPGFSISSAIHFEQDVISEQHGCFLLHFLNFFTCPLNKEMNEYSGMVEWIQFYERSYETWKGWKCNKVSWTQIATLPI